VAVGGTVVGLLLVLTGLLPASAATDELRRTAPVLGYLVAITVVAELADRAGLFEVAARAAARAGRGRVRLLFLLVAVLATVTTVILSLDTTAVLLTPVVLALAAGLELDPLPFAYAAVWLANTASLLLPVSNLTNLLAVDRLGTGTIGFAGRMWPAQLAVLVVTLAVLLLRHRRSLRGRYAPPAPVAVPDRGLLLLSAGVVAALAPALLAGVTPWIAGTAAATVLLGGYAVRDRAALRPALVPWRLVLTVAGLFLVVATLQRHGLTTLLADVAGRSGTGTGALVRVGGTAGLAANAVDNLPAYLALEPVAREGDRLLAVLVGVNAGPLVTLWASLATLLWRDRCRAGGLRIGAGRFALEGLLVAPAAVLAGTLALSLT
jgi:arsenical pump membrane protein